MLRLLLQCNWRWCEKNCPLFHHHHFISHFLCYAQLVLTMPVQSDDPQLSIGASIEVEAVFVTSLAECSRRYGTNAKTKVVPGLVVSFGQDSSYSSWPTPCHNIHCRWFLLWRQCDQTTKAEHLKRQVCQMFCTTTWRVEGDSSTTRESNHCHISSSCCSSSYFTTRTAITASSTSWRRWQQEYKYSLQCQYSQETCWSNNNTNAWSCGNATEPWWKSCSFDFSNNSVAGLKQINIYWNRRLMDRLSDNCGPFNTMCVGPHWSKTAIEVPLVCHNLTIFFACSLRSCFCQ